MQLRRILFFLLAAVAFYACASRENGELSGKSSPKEDSQQRTFGAEGGDFTFSLTSDFSLSSEITQGKEWIIPTSKATDYELVFRILPNETIEARQGEIVFTTKTHIWKVEIRQEGVDPILFAKTDRPAVFSSEASSLKVTLICNVPVTLAISEGCDWISLDGEPVKEEIISYSFLIAENTDYSPREAVLTFSNEAFSLSSGIKVSQAQKDAFILSGGDVEAAEEGERLSFEIARNIDFSVTADAPWIVPVTVQPKALVRETVSFDILPNDSDGFRDGCIIFTSALGEQRINVHQLWHEHLLDNTVPGVYGFSRENWALRDGEDVLCCAFRDGRWDETFIHPATGTFFSAGGIGNNTNEGDEVDIDILQNFSTALPARSARKFKVVGVTEELVYLKDGENNGLILKK